MSKIKFAVVGAGHIGKRHAEMIRRDAEGELVALVDPRGAEACDALDFGVPFFNDINDLLLKELIDHSYQLVYKGLPKKVRDENPLR